MLRFLPTRGGLWMKLRGPKGSLRRRFLEGSAWHLGVTGYCSGLLVIQTLVATHFVRDPREFGLINAFMWAYTLAEVFTTWGLDMALARHRGEARDLLGPIWTVQVVRGFTLGLAVATAGTAMSWYYGEPRIAPLAWTAALSAPLNGLAGLGPVLTLRELDYRRAALFQALETTLGAAACCMLLATLQSAWAVAIGLNTMALARVIASYCLRPERPRFDFRWGRLRLFGGFAVSSFLSAILAFGTERGDDFVVGTLLGLEGLGLYHLAFLYANLPCMKVGRVLSNLLVPIFARLQGEPARLRQAFMRYLTGLLSLAAVAFAVLYLCAPLLFQWIGHGRFLAAVQPFRILCICGVVRFFHFSAEALFIAIGRPRHGTLAHLAQLLVLAAVVVPFTMNGGISGAAAATGMASLGAAVYSAWALRAVFREHELAPATLPIMHSGPAARPPIAPAAEARRTVAGVPG